MNRPVLVLARFEHDPSHVREVAREILDGSPFREHAPSPVARGIERVLEFVGELIGRALTTVGASTITAWVIVAVSVAVMVAAVWRWTRGVGVEATTAPETADPGGVPAARWYASADEAEARGDLGTALRHRYLGVVAALEERGVVDPSPGRTIRELDAELAVAHPRLHAPVAAVGGRVERVAYGGEQAGREDLDVARAAREAVAAPAGART